IPDSPSASPPAVHQLKISNLPPIAAPDTPMGTSATTSNRLHTVSPRMYRTILCLLGRSSLSTANNSRHLLPPARSKVSPSRTDSLSSAWLKPDQRDREVLTWYYYTRRTLTCDAGPCSVGAPSGLVETMGEGTLIKRKRPGIEPRRRVRAGTRARGTPPGRSAPSARRAETRKREGVTALAPSSETTALRAWAEVDLVAIARNIQAVRRLLSRSCRLMAVVKADAYGHGVVPVCRAALAADAAWLGVATLGEGVALRLGEIRAPILVLGGLTAGEVADATGHGLSISITSQAMAET